jgi:hypothetical protein
MDKNFIALKIVSYCLEILNVSSATWKGDISKEVSFVAGGRLQSMWIEALKKFKLLKNKEKT